jgi:hypothetical protein
MLKIRKFGCFLNVTRCKAPMAVMPEIVMLTAINGDLRAENILRNIQRCFSIHQKSVRQMTVGPKRLGGQRLSLL